MKQYSANGNGERRHDWLRKTLSAVSVLISRLEDLACVLFVASMLICVFFEVLFRYILNMSLAWTEELARLFIIWLTFSAAAFVFRNRSHVRIDLVVNMLSPRAKAIVLTIIELTILGSLLLLVKAGSEMTMTFWASKMPVTGLTRGLIYLPVPIFCSAMIFHSLEMLVRGDTINLPSHVAKERTQR